MEKHITVGVAGHVDHGKTSLVRWLTGIDTDRLKEEKQRGLSIEPGIAPLSLPSGTTVALVDVPGSARLRTWFPCDWWVLELREESTLFSTLKVVREYLDAIPDGQPADYLGVVQG